jgi:hypothetical protein
MRYRKLLVCISIIFLQTFTSYCANAQFVSRREEPILIGSAGQAISIPWTSMPAQPFSNFSSWDTVGLAATPNGSVFTITQGQSSPIVVGGSFDSIGTMPCNSIALYKSGSGNIWQPLGSGLQGGAVFATVSYQTELFAAGSFDTAGGVIANRIAMWDGTSWHSLGFGDTNGVDSTVLALAVMGDSLYVGGNFKHAGVLHANYIAIWNIRTSQWETISENGITGVDGGVAALLVADTALYIGGGFRHVGSIPASKIAQLKKGQWGTMGSGLDDTDGIIECLNPNGGHANNYDYIQTFLAGGHFSRIGDISATDLAMWTIYSNSWSPITDDPFRGASGTVYSVASGVGTYVGGDFILSDPALPKYFIALDNGVGNIGAGIDEPAFTIFDRTIALALTHKGDQSLDGYFEDVLIGGAFENAGGYHTPHFAHWMESADVAESKTNAVVSLTSFPNPVEQDATISFTLAKRDHIILTLYDELGQKIATLANGDFDAGVHEIPFHKGVANKTGILLAALKTSTAVSTCKVVLK